MSFLLLVSVIPENSSFTHTTFPSSSSNAYGTGNSFMSSFCILPCSMANSTYLSRDKAFILRKTTILTAPYTAVKMVAITPAPIPTKYMNTVIRQNIPIRYNGTCLYRLYSPSTSLFSFICHCPSYPSIHNANDQAQF